MTNSSFYIRFFNEINDRIDFNYNNPKYDWIDNVENYELLGNPLFLDSISNGSTPDSIPMLEGTDTVLFIKNENVKELELNLRNRYYIFRNDFDSRNQSLKLRENDILLSMTGTIGNACLYNLDEEATINQNIVVIRFKKLKVLHDFGCRLLNTNFVKSQIEREFTSPQTPYLNTDKIKSLKLKIPSIDKQREILKKVSSIEQKAIFCKNNVDEYLLESEKKILSNLNIRIVELEKIDYYCDFIDNKNRIDFEYNNPKYDLLYRLLENSKYPIANLEDCVDFLRESRNPLMHPDDEFEYIDIGNINTRFGDINSVTMMGKDATSSRMRRVIHEGNIIVSTTRPTRNAIALIPSYLDNQICSTGFGVLKCNDSILTDFLFLMLRSKFVTYQFQKLCSGSGYPEINQEKDLPKIKIIRPDSVEVQQEIVDKIKPIIEKAKGLLPKSQKKWQEAKDLFERLA